MEQSDCKLLGSCGVLHYELNERLIPPYKLVLNIDQVISYYYFSTIPKAIRARKQMHTAHISVVRKEIPRDLTAWGKYEKHIVVFEYENYIRNDDNYYWLDAFSIELERIREELGLENKIYIRPMPEGSPYKKRFHFTIGNTKEAR